jgi:polysaccharide deacetylase family protein (PEP-CTERM system associated)
MKMMLSVDVEDWFQVDNLKQAINKDSWEENISRVERSVDLILDLLDRKSSKATFFILGWIAERHPNLIKKIFNESHEIACHGYNHELVYSLSEQSFRQDVLKAKNILENITGKEIIGYRAPNFSITDWSIDVLKSLNFRYDSSLFPTITHQRYGKINGLKIPDNSIFEIRNDFYQVMLSYLEVMNLKLPWSGGFYFRFIPYSIFKVGVKNILKERGSYLFYIHPWEFDPEQPKIKNIKLQYKFRHYSNLKKTEKKFEKLLSDFTYCPIKELIPTK